MARPSKYSPELLNARCGWSSIMPPSTQWATIRSVAEKLGCPTEALRRWVRQAERDTGKRPGLRRKMSSCGVRMSILKKASAYFVQAQLDRRAK